MSASDEAPANDVNEDTMNPEYRELTRDMFEKITEYLNGELSGTPTATIS